MDEIKNDIESLKIKLKEIEAENLILRAKFKDLSIQFYMVKSGIFDKIICHELHVIDGGGVPRISAHICPDRTAELLLRDASSQVRIANRTYIDGDVTFGICDENGIDRIVVSDHPDEFSKLSLFDPSGTDRLSCITFEDGDFMCQILDTDEIPRILATTSDGYAKILLNTTESEEI